MKKDAAGKISIRYLIFTSFIVIFASNVGTMAFLAMELEKAMVIVPALVGFMTGFLLTNHRAAYREQKGFVIYLPMLIPVFAAMPFVAFGWLTYSRFGFQAKFLLAFLVLLNQLSIALSVGNAAWVFANVAGIVCFLIGERLSCRVKKVTRKLPSGLFFAACAGVFVVICGIGQRSQYLRDLSRPDFYPEQAWVTGREDDPDSYHFPYERGWSSTDLRPYYVENPDNQLAKLGTESTFRISEYDKMPVLDGAEAAYPVYSAFAYACYEDIAGIQQAAKAGETYPYAPIQFTNTIEAYKKLLTGEVDIFFGARPSKAQEQLAEEAGKKLVLTPIAKEGFVFFVSTENKVDALTSEQIRGIYSGEITNWSRVGGSNIPILAFQRPENSGSQTMMQYFMGDVPLKEHLEVEYESDMMGVLMAVADDYQNKKSAIGYSFRYFASGMTEINNIKFLALDGVYPDAENIRTGKYPMTTNLYAITLEDNTKETIVPFLEFMQSAQGQELVEATGYVAIY